MLKKKPHCIDRAYNYTFKGYEGANERRYISMDIERCQNSSNSTCKSNADIDVFLTNHMFKIYSMQRKIDFSKDDTAELIVGGQGLKVSDTTDKEKKKDPYATPLDPNDPEN